MQRLDVFVTNNLHSSGREDTCSAGAPSISIKIMISPSASWHIGQTVQVQAQAGAQHTPTLAL